MRTALLRLSIRLVLGGVALAGTHTHAQGNTLGFTGRSPPPTTATYLTTASNATDTASYSFAGLSLGLPAPNRTILVGIVSRAAAPRLISTVTIGGVPASIIYQNQVNNSVVGFAMVRVPTGTTGTVAVEFDGTMVNAGVGVWSIENLQSTAVLASTSWTTTRTGTLNVPANGVAIGMNYNNSNAMAWSAGLTSRFATNLADSLARHHTGGSMSTIPAVTPLTVTVSGTADASSIIGAAISLR